MHREVYRHVDVAYRDLVRTVLESGVRKPSRTGLDTLSYFNYNYSISLEEGFPLLTTKQISWKSIVVELLWFLSGNTDVGLLHKHGCKFWDAWVREDNTVPSAYGNFWRAFPGQEGLIDQLTWIQDTLRTNPTSRRMVCSAWSPQNAHASALPPCHCLFVFNVQDGKLCCHLTQRSGDIALGIPFNIASYALLTHLFARFAGLTPGVFAHTIVDAHIYTSGENGFIPEPYTERADHVPGLCEQLGRTERPLPRLFLDPSIQDLSDIEPLLHKSTAKILEVFKLAGYNPHPFIPFEVAV